MSNSMYRRGYRFEISVKKYIEHLGAYVIRSAGSHGVFDLIAVKNGSVFGIQCKKDGQLSVHDRKVMLEYYKTHKIIPLLAFRRNRKLVILDLRTNEPVEEL